MTTTKRQETKNIFKINIPQSNNLAGHNYKTSQMSGSGHQTARQNHKLISNFRNSISTSLQKKT